MKRAQAIDLFIHKDKVAVFWFVVALAVTAGFWWERQRLVKNLMAKPQFFVMDANHTYYLPAAMDFGSAKEIHAAQTRSPQSGSAMPTTARSATAGWWR